VLPFQREPTLRYQLPVIRAALAQVAAFDVLAALAAWLAGRPLLNSEGLRQLGGLDVLLFLLVLIFTKPGGDEASRSAYVKRALSALCLLVVAVILWAKRV
jgi:hypothetical protein